MQEFNPELEIEHIIENIRNHFGQFPPKTMAVIGISGGKDSTIAAALLARALGPDRIMGVIMPQGTQPDLDDAILAIKSLDINGMQANINSAVTSIRASIAMSHLINKRSVSHMSRNAEINTPARMRMSMLYAIAASIPDGALVINTCNASEDCIGYSTKNGDAAGDYSVLKEYLVSEILAMGRCMNEIPEKLVMKTPSDGLCGQSDEDRFGFTYNVLDNYILTGECDDTDTLNKILGMYHANTHKLRPMPACPRLFERRRFPQEEFGEVS